MNQKRYAQLLSTAVAIQTTATFINSQVNDFAAKFKSGYADLSMALDCMSDTLKCAANDMLRDSVKLALDKKQHSLTKIFERPALIYKKEITRLSNTIEKRIAPELLKPSKFDVKKILNILEQTKPLLENSTDLINNCLEETQTCYSRIAILQQLNAGEIGERPPAPMPRI